MTNRETAVPASVIKYPMVSATIARLIFFGGRYLSLLFVAHLLGEGATGFLLAVAIVEFFRIVFDYGLENSILARFHQEPGVEANEFLRGKGHVRLVATLLGQVVTTGAVTLLCLRNDVQMTLPFAVSLQFSCLMGFGYLQAHLQTGQPGGMAALIRPLGFATVLQGALLMLAHYGVAPVWLCVLSFEIMALIACTVVARRLGRPSVAHTSASSASKVPSSAFDPTTFRKVLLRIAPMGNVALIGVAYTRVDVFVVSWVAAGALLTQYLIYQRLASAPLMFFSTVASVSIASLSDARLCPENLSERIVRFRRLGYGAAAASGGTLVAATPWAASFFILENVDIKLLGLQGLALALQISNGFHAALMISLQKPLQLWSVARNNTVLAAFLLPLCGWKLGVVGVALALCVVELFCAAQYARLFRDASRFDGPAYAK